MWDTSLQSLMFGRMIEHMNWFFALVSVVTLALGGSQRRPPPSVEPRSGRSIVEKSGLISGGDRW